MTARKRPEDKRNSGVELVRKYGREHMVRIGRKGAIAGHLKAGHEMKEDKERYSK